MPAVPDHYFEQFIAPGITQQGFGMSYPKFIAAAGSRLFEFTSRMRGVLREVEKGNPAFDAIPEEKIENVRTCVDDVLPIERKFREMEKQKGFVSMPPAIHLYQDTRVLCYSPDAQRVADDAAFRISATLGIQTACLLDTYFPSPKIHGDFLESMNECTDLHAEGLLEAIRLFLGTKIKELLEMKISLAEEK